MHRHAPLAALLLLLAGAMVPARAQAPAAELTGTLRSVHEKGHVTLGYRTSSLPFSYLNPLHQPIGHTIDPSRAVVAQIRIETGKPVTIDWQPVTPDSRIH